MTVDANPETAPARSGADGGAARDVAGLLFARLTVVPALLAMAWLVAGLVFFAAGWFRPVPVTILAVVLAVPTLWFGVRAVPGLPDRAAMALPSSSASTGGRTPWWPLVAVIVIAAVFLGDQIAYHSQFVIITRDPGAYFQFATWLSKHGSVPLPANEAVFGGTHGGLLDFGSYATYQRGDTVVLQFMAGLPMVLAGAMWVGGYQAALLMAPVLGALAVLTFAGLAARLVGVRWAPLAALVVAVSLPMQFTSRSTYSEPLAEILFLGGLALVLDGLRGSSLGSPGLLRGARTAAALGGLALGITVLVRIDGASDLLPVIPFCGALFVRRRPQAGWLSIGLAVGTVLGIGEGLLFSWPYLMVTNQSSVVPLLALMAVVIVATIAATLYFRRRPPARWWPWLPNTALVASFVFMLAFWVRPHVQQTRAPNPTTGVMARTFQELALHWVEWYLGIPLIVAATIGAGLLARACLRGRGGDWALPLMVLTWASLIFMYRPAITADQPWASRRLVPEVLPAFVLLGIWAIARGAAWLRSRRSGSASSGAVRTVAWLRPVLVAVCGLAVVVPAVVADWGLGVSTSNGFRVTSDGMARTADFQDELAGIEGLCSALPAKAAVMFVDPIQGPQVMQSVRGMCGVPTAGVPSWDGKGGDALSSDSAAALAKSVTASARRSGRVPVVIAGNEDQLKPLWYMGAVRHVLTLDTTRDPDVIHGVPTDPTPQRFDIWMWTPAR